MFAALEVRPKAILPIAFIVTMVIHFIFYKGLRVPLPWGLLMPIQW
jgi:putative tricarboxylic transport membrane protein